MQKCPPNVKYGRNTYSDYYKVIAKTHALNMLHPSLNQDPPHDLYIPKRPWFVCIENCFVIFLITPLLLCIENCSVNVYPFIFMHRKLLCECPNHPFTATYRRLSCECTNHPFTAMHIKLLYEFMFRSPLHCLV